MSTPSDDRPTVDDVMETHDVGVPHRDRTQHGGAGRIDDDALERLVEQERADVGASDYDPDHIPPATDEPTDVDLTDTEEYQGELTEARRVARQDTGDFPPTR
jgi:hypothetical protein